MKILILLFSFGFPMQCFGSTELEANGKKFTVHLDEHVKPYMALRVLHTVLPSKNGKKTEAERKLIEWLGLKQESEVKITSLLPKEIFFSAELERKLIRLTFCEEDIEFNLYHRILNLPWENNYNISLIDCQIFRKAEPVD